jgi:hypothetical protein
MANSEQVGTKRHDSGSPGDIHRLYISISLMATHFISLALALSAGFHFSANQMRADYRPDARFAQ